MRTTQRVLKSAVFAACLVPLAMLVWRAFTSGLGANPIEFITHATGDWTLRFLLITLAITPLRRISGWNRIIGFRRMLGLFAFFYGTLHLFTYLWLDKFFAWSDILHDIPKRPFITIGFSAFVLLLPLALTSTAGWIRRLGGRRWRALHRVIYVAAVFGVIHYWWLVKADITLPATYACILAFLFAIRAWFAADQALRRNATAIRRTPDRGPQQAGPALRLRSGTPIDVEGSGRLERESKGVGVPVKRTAQPQ